MLYVLYRVIITIIILVIFIFFIKTLHASRIARIISSSFLCLVVLLLFLFPVEGAFIRFNSLNDSFSYSTFGQQKYKTFQTKQTAFIVSGKNSNSLSLNTVTNYHGEYGLMNYSVERIYYPTQIYDYPQKDNTYSVYAYSVLNKDTKQSLFMVGILGDNSMNKISVRTYDGKDISDYTDDSVGDSYNVKYYFVLDSTVPEGYYIYVNDNKYVLEKR